MTTTRAIILLRQELASQLSRTNKELVVATEESLKDLDNRSKLKEKDRLLGASRRLQYAIEALGALMLGDIEDGNEPFKTI